MLYAFKYDQVMQDTVTELAYPSQNRVYFAYTNEILFGSYFRAYFPVTGSSKLTMIIVNLI